MVDDKSYPQFKQFLAVVDIVDAFGCVLLLLMENVDICTIHVMHTHKCIIDPGV